MKQIQADLLCSGNALNAQRSTVQKWKQPDIKPLTSEGLFPPASASSNKNPLRSSRSSIYFGVQKTYSESAI